MYLTFKLNKILILITNKNKKKSLKSFVYK